MKKRMFIMILSALLVLNASACDYTFQPKESEPKANAENSGLGTKDGAKTNTGAGAKSVKEGSISCNGNERTLIKYEINQDGEMTLHIEEWNEDHTVSISSDTEIEVLKSVKEAIAINNELACLFLKQQGEITVIRFEKGCSSKTVTSLDVSEDVVRIEGNFINESVGYLFAFEEVMEHATGGAKLSSLFITEDGGSTWNSIDVQNAPSISLRENIIFSKMVSKDVGLISGDIFAADFDFCDRSLLTTDGGRNWVNVADLPQINELPWAIVTDFAQTDDGYVLTVRYEVSDATDGYGYAEYKLTDLNTWVRIN